MQKIQALHVTALGFCLFHYFADRDLQARPIYGWFSVVIVGMMVLVGIAGHFHQKRQVQLRSASLLIAIV